jgi:hypothetical protein
MIEREAKYMKELAQIEGQCKELTDRENELVCIAGIDACSCC